MSRFTKQPTPWSCGPTAASILTGIPVEDIIAKIGHDGSRIAEPEKPEPWGREAFTHDELVLALAELGWATLWICAAVDPPRLGHPDFETLKIRLMSWRVPTMVVIRKPLGDHVLAWDVPDDSLIDPLTGDYVNEQPYPVVGFEPMFTITQSRPCGAGGPGRSASG